LKPVEPEDLYNLVMVSSPRGSPDGSKALYVVSRPRRDRYESSIWLAGEAGYRPLTRGPGDKCPDWSPDGSLYSFVRGEGEGRGARWSIMVGSPEGGEPWPLATFEVPVVRAVWNGEGTSLAVELVDRDGRWRPYEERDVLEVERLPVLRDGVGWAFDRFRSVRIVDYPGGVVRSVSPEGVDSWAAAWSPDGSSLAYARSMSQLDPDRAEIVVYDVETGSERVLASGLAVQALAWSPDGRMLAVNGHRWERGRATHFRVMVLDAGTGEEVDCLSCILGRNTRNTVNSDARGPQCSENLYWPQDGYVYFHVHDRGRAHVYRARPGGDPEPLLAPEKAVVDEFHVPGQAGAIYYTLMTPVEPPELHLYNAGESQRLTNHNDAWLRERVLEEPLEFQVETRYGQEIDLWILPPAGGAGCEDCKPWALYIHGGPKTSFGYGFMLEFHVLSGAGIAVVYGNPHGSDGYSEEFADIRGAYGTVDYEDLMTIADAAPSLYPPLSQVHAAVMGGSYGGWMTNYIITKTHRFRAAVTMRGCSNWSSFYGASDIGWTFAPDQLGSTPWTDPKPYIEKSPLFHADKIRTPTLIIHATQDYRCPMDQALTLYTALRVNGVPTRLLLFPQENHDLSRSGKPRRRVRRLHEELAWLRRHLLAD